MRRIARLLATIALGALAPLAIANPAAAATLEVCAAGCPYSTIQSAVDAAVGGWPSDMVVVKPGVYAESVVVNKLVDVVGEGYGIAGYGRPLVDAEEAIVTGDGSGPAFTLSGDARLYSIVVQDVAPAHPAIRMTGQARIVNGTARRNTTGIDIAVSGDVTTDVTQVDVLDGHAAGTGVRARTTGARIVLQNLRVTGHVGGTAVDVAGVGTGNHRANLSVIDTSDAATGVRLAELDEAVMNSAEVDVPAGGVGILLDVGLTRVELNGPDVTGAADRAGTVGIRLAGGQAGVATLDNLRLLDLATVVDVAAGWSSGSTWISGNHLRPLPGGTAFASASSSPVSAEENWIACPGGCTRVAGAGNAAIDASPSLALRAVHDGELLEGATVRAGAVFVRDDGSGEPTNSPFGVVATVTSTLGTIAGSPHSIWGRISTGPTLTVGAFPRTGTITVTTEDGISAEASGTVVGRAPWNLSEPTITGTMVHGTWATCNPGTWSHAPQQFSFHWLGDNDRLLQTGQRYYVTPGPMEQVRCRVLALTEGRHTAAAESQKRSPEYRSMRVLVTPVNHRGRVIRCRRGLCTTRRAVGVRFRAATRPAVRTRATIVVQRYMRGRWVRWVSGRANLPQRGYLYVPARLIPPGRYRVVVGVEGSGSWLGGRSRWVNWRITR